MNPNAVSEDAFVMTTWHAGENPEDVAFFLVFCTLVGGTSSWNNIVFSESLSLHVGNGPQRAVLTLPYERMHEQELAAATTPAPALRRIAVMTVQEVLARLEALGDEARRKHNTKAGAPETSSV